MSTSKADKPAAGLQLMRAAMRDWDDELRRLAEKNKEHCTYIVAGGVSLPALILRVFAKRVPKPGESVFSRTVEALVWHTHGTEPADSKAFLGDDIGADTIRVAVSYKAKKDGTVPPPSVGEPPHELIMRSHTVSIFSTTKMDAVDNLSSGQFVILNGVSGRAWVGGGDTPDPRWIVSFDVGMIEPIQGMSLQSMYLAAAGTGTDYLFPNDIDFDEANPNSRYNKDRTHFVSVHAPAVTAEEKEQREARWSRECGETRLVTKNWTNKTWEIEEQQGRERKLRANLVLAHLQWPPRTEYREGTKEEILIGLSLYEEQLREFGISDIDAWVVLAPLIFQRLSFKSIAYIDTKGTETNFGGVTADESIDFALQLNGMAVIPDLEECYRKIGVPVTADFVVDIQQHMPGGAARAPASSKDLLETLSPVVPVTGPSSDPAVSRALVDLASKGKGPEFRALINYSPSNAVVKGLAELNAEEGSALVLALYRNANEDLDDSTNKLFDMMATGQHVHLIIFALCDELIPLEVRSRRNANLMAYMAGQAAQGAPAIEDGSAQEKVVVEEVAESAQEAQEAQAAKAVESGARFMAEQDADEDEDATDTDAPHPKPSRKRQKKKPLVNKKGVPKKSRT